jgi:ornithine carbamoyltransferase
MSELFKKHFLKLLDFTPAQITDLLALAAQLKSDKKKVLIQRGTQGYFAASFSSNSIPRPGLSPGCI